MSKKDVGIKIPILDPENYHEFQVKMHLHLLSQDESYVDCIEKGPHVPMRASTEAERANDAEQTTPKQKAEWTPEDYEEV